MMIMMMMMPILIFTLQAFGLLTINMPSLTSTCLTSLLFPIGLHPQVLGMSRRSNMCVRKEFRRSMVALLHLYFIIWWYGESCFCCVQVFCQSFVHPKTHLLLSTMSWLRCCLSFSLLRSCIFMALCQALDWTSYPILLLLLFNGLVDAQAMLNCQARPQAFEGAHI